MKNIQEFLKQNTEMALSTPRHLSLKGNTLHLMVRTKLLLDSFKHFL